MKEYEVLETFSQEEMRNKRGNGFTVKESLNGKYFVIATALSSKKSRLQKKVTLWYALFEKDSLEFFSEKLDISDEQFYLRFNTLEVTNSKNLYFLMLKFERSSTSQRIFKAYSVYRKILGTPVFKEIPIFQQDTAKIFINDLLLQADKKIIY